MENSTLEAARHIRAPLSLAKHVEVGEFVCEGGSPVRRAPGARARYEGYMLNTPSMVNDQRWSL